MDEEVYNAPIKKDTEIIITKRKPEKEITTNKRRKKKEPKLEYKDQFDYSSIIQIDTENPLHISDGQKRLLSNLTETFKKLPPAFDFVQYYDSKWSPIFAHDYVQGKGAKSFIPSGYKRIFDRIRDTYSKVVTEKLLPAYYEVLVGNRPCHLFFDLEYDLDPNQGINSFVVLKQFVDDVYAFMNQLGIMKKKERKAEVLILYSPNPEKISFHLHLVGDNWIFENQYHCGAFVRNFVMWTIRKYGNCLDKHPYFFAQRKRGGRKFFADLAIYTSNRPFRTAYSAKCRGIDGKNPLLTLDEWKGIGMEVNDVHSIKPDLKTFLMSLPLYVADSKTPYAVIRMKNPDTSDPCSTSYGKFYDNPDGGMLGYGMNFVRQGSSSDPISEVCRRIVYEHIQYEKTTEFISHDSESNIVVIATRSTKCPIKEYYTGIPYHRSNHPHYIVNYQKMTIKLACPDEECQKKKTFKYPIPDKWLIDIMDNMGVQNSMADKDVIEFLNETLDIVKLHL